MAHTAALYGHMVRVRWLIQEQGFAMDRKVMVAAAMSGNLELVRWLRANGCPWDFMTCFFAASNLELIRWLRANGCPWDWRTCFGAVHKGHVEVLRWARENGCPWRAPTRDKAAVELGYTDDFGNLVDVYGDPVQ